METHQYTQIVQACKGEFDKRHGANHDKYPWSPKAYDALIHEYLRYDRFVLQQYGLKWTQPKGCTYIFVHINKSMYRRIVYCADLDIVKPIYNHVCMSKKAKIRKRVERLHEMLSNIEYDKDIILCDVVYLSLFLECALKQGKITDYDYTQCKERIQSHVKSEKRREQIGFALELAMCCSVM